MKLILFIITLSIFTSCQEKMETNAKAVMQARSNSKISGNVSFKQYGDKLVIATNIKGLNPNQKHGFHIHEYGNCSAPDAKSAGGHFSPKPHDHGAPDSKMHHAGDLGNLKANTSGIAKVEISTNELSLIKGEKNSIIGRAVIIHEKNDDLTSQPSGNAGARVACGIVVLDGEQPNPVMEKTKKDTK